MVISLLDGAERGEVAADQWRRSVRYVAAEPAWWTDTPRPAFPSNPAASVRIDRLLRALGLDAALLDRPIAQLSTGERQRLALARALSDEPRVLLLDEPCASLDPTSAAMVEELIKFQILSSRSVILVSHRSRSGRAAVARTAAASEACGGGIGSLRAGGAGMNYVPLSPLDLALAATMLVINGGLSVAFQLRLERTLAVAAARMVAQLLLAGLVLKFVFQQTSPVWTAAIAALMIGAAGYEASARKSAKSAAGKAGTQHWHIVPGRHAVGAIRRTQ